LPKEWPAAVADQVENRRKKFRKKEKIESFNLDTFLQDNIKIAASGRAPYTRDLMEKAFAIVFSNDPMRNDPKASGGPLEETDEVLKRRLDLPIPQQTNNHLVRHRLLILERTLADLVKKFADGEPKQIGKVTIEVVRDLQKFSGKSAQEKAKMLGMQLGHHRSVVKKLEAWCEESPKKFEINYSLIKKARIADELEWRCPYTGMNICVLDLLPNGTMDREHVIPKSLRPSDSLESLVITYKAVNKMKGQRTAMQFMKECSGQAIPDLPGIELLPLKKFLAFINGLAPHFRPGRDASDDDRRCWRRKEFLLLEKYDHRDADFTGRDLTQTAHLVKLANLQTQSWFAKQGAVPLMEPLSGSVTGAVRRSWDTLGCLAKACPRVLDETGKPRIKSEIREITHLHHALDAAMLALAAHYLPRDGNVWELLNRRSVDNNGRRLLENTGQFTFAEGNRPQMKNLPPSVKAQLVERLAEKRVVQHLPRKMSGLKVQQNIWGVEKIDEEGHVTLKQMARVLQPNGQRKWTLKPQPQGSDRLSKLHGVKPNKAAGKLSSLKGALIIDGNFGIALDPLPQAIPFTRVWETLRELTKKNNGKRVRVLRNGMVIEVEKGNFQGRWRVHSVKDSKTGHKINIAYPELVEIIDNTPGCKRDVLVKTLLKDGLTISAASYAGP
jgi:hypothetical protein